MQVASACVLHRALTFDKDSATTLWTTVAIVAAIAAETAYHSITDEQTVHELFFLALIVLVSIKTRSLIKGRVAAREDRKMLTRLTIFGTGMSECIQTRCEDGANGALIGCFLFGYFLWQIDHIYCPQLTALKHQMGMPWSFVLEFHGWWHFFTAIGAYVFMVMVDCLTKEQVELVGGPFEWLGAAQSLTKRD